MGGFTNDARKFINSCELYNANIKKKNFTPLKIITDEGPNFRYIFDLWELPNNLTEDDSYIYTFWTLSTIFLNI